MNLSRLQEISIKHNINIYKISEKTNKKLKKKKIELINEILSK